MAHHGGRRPGTGRPKGSGLRSRSGGRDRTVGGRGVPRRIGRRRSRHGNRGAQFWMQIRRQTRRAILQQLPELAHSTSVRPMRVALYCRVSTSDQDCDRQVEDLTAFADRAGHEVVATFVETASGAGNSRPERKKVIELARRREIGAVLVTELSRWGRSTSDLVDTLDELHGWKVCVIAQTGLSFDLATPQGRLLRTLMAGLAEFERDLIRERVKSGMAVARIKGTKSGKPFGRQVGFRPTDGKVGRVLKMRGEGYSLRSIAKHLRMSTMTVQQILKRESAPAA